MKNIIGFHGCDSKDGCTMIAQSVALALSKKHKNSDVLLLSLCNCRNDQFAKGVPISLSSFTEKLKRKIPIKKNELVYGKLTEKVFFLDGFEKDASKLDLPDGWLENLLNDLGKQFEIIVLDTGAKCSDVLGIEALKKAGKRYLVTTGGEASLNQIWRDRKDYEKLGVDFEALIINKLKGPETYLKKHIEEAYGKNFQRNYVLPELFDWRMAELAHKTFFEMKKIGFTRGINRIIKDIKLEIEDGK